MKVAVVGSGPIAILAAYHFDQLGADVVLFQRSPLGGNVRFLLDHFPTLEIPYDGETISLERFFQEQIVSKGQELEKYNLTKSGDVLRIHKRFVHPEESIPNRTRMHDLFRIVYSMNPKESILKQVEENPEVFKQLGEEVLSSLHKPVEHFADFDIVIEATGRGTKPHPMGASLSLALNEYNIQDFGVIYYEKEIFTKLNLTNKKSVALVGEGVSAKLSLLKLKDWLLGNPEHLIHWITYKTKDSASELPWLDAKVEELFQAIKERFETSKEEFENKLRQWRELEDYEKVKIPKPIEPKAQLMIYEGYEATSVDKLLDQGGIFLTIESPSFRDHSLKVNDMITLAVDGICVARGGEKTSLKGLAMQEKEPGHYQIQTESLANIGEELVKIEKDLLNFFKKAEA